MNPETTLDSDSSSFSWIEVDGHKIRNTEFPNNYIQHIKENIGKYEFIFVSSHEEVRKALVKNCIFFYLMYPNITEKEMYIQRYKERGSSDEFINLISENWEKWIKQLGLCTVGCKNLKLEMPIETEIQYLLKWEDRAL